MVTLRAITAENFDAILGLQVGVDQRELVCSNAESIAQAYVQPECIPLAIYAVDTPVGFAMYCVDRDDNEWWLYRLMVEETYQGRGYGRALFRSSWSWYRQTGADTGCIWASI